jgi:hypothetical protein
MAWWNDMRGLEPPRKVVSTQRGQEERLPIFMLTYRASTHDATGTSPTIMVFLPCDLLFSAPPDKKHL